MLSASAAEISSVMGQNVKNFGLNKSPMKARRNFFVEALEWGAGAE